MLHSSILNHRRVASVAWHGSVEEVAVVLIGLCFLAFEIVSQPLSELSYMRLPMFLARARDSRVLFQARSFYSPFSPYLG